MYYNKNYYPTPGPIIEKMLEPYTNDQLNRMHVLEPSAGMGAIADAIRLKGVKRENIYCCEIDTQLKAALQGKKYKVIQEDFLSYSGSHNFELIIMNPPFDQGAQHLLKAWDILRTGDIVCLLNSETLNNPSTEVRQDLKKIIKANGGTVKELGDAFNRSDRSTLVNVSLVRISKKTEASKVDFSKMKNTAKADEPEVNSSSTEAQRYDYIQGMVDSYTRAVETTQELFKAMYNFRVFCSPFMDASSAAKACTEFFQTSQGATRFEEPKFSDAHNEFVMNLQKKAWDKIFDNTRLSGSMTAKTKQKFHDWRDEKGGTDLNRENIAMLFDAIFQQKATIQKECITEVFDYITEASEKNKQAIGETFKTNSFYMVPRKFILNWVLDSWDMRWNEWRLSYKKEPKLDDIDRALCMITGRPYEEITTISKAAKDWCKDPERAGVVESEFFTFKLYKKGTGHFTFKDQDLCTQLNRIACEHKGWQLPEQEMFRGKARRG